MHFSGPIDARDAGIETAFQTLALIDDPDVPDNLFFGREMTKWNGLGPFRVLDYKAMGEATMEGLERLAANGLRQIDVDIGHGKQKSLGVGNRHTAQSRGLIRQATFALFHNLRAAAHRGIIHLRGHLGPPTHR